MKTALKYLWSARGVSYNVYVTNYMARITALGETMPDTTRLTALNTLTTSLSAILAKLDLFYVTALNDVSLSGASRLNLINPSNFRLDYVSSPTYGTKGFTGNGTTSYATTNYNAATNAINYLLDSASRFMYVETVPSSGTTLDGTLNTGSRNNMSYAASTTMRINSTNSLDTAPTMTGALGYRAMNRSSSTVVTLYNGTTKIDRTQTSTAIISETQAILRAGSSYSNAEIGLYGLGASLTEAEHNLIRSSYITYRTAIGL